MVDTLLARVKLQVCIRNLIKIYGYSQGMEIIYRAIETETRNEKNTTAHSRDPA